MSHTSANLGPMPPVTSLRFAEAARRLSTEARRIGLVVPGFRSPPGVAGADRSLRRRPDGHATVAVRIRDRPLPDVVADMVDGVLAANGVLASDGGPGSEGEPRRRRLLEAVLGRPASNAA